MTYVSRNNNMSIHLYQFLYSNLDNSIKSKAICLDLAKAFDTVYHKIVLNILPSVEIYNKSPKWFESYLQSRK